ncbi:MAG: hypothetical protein MI921_28495 [Cytophagales bacterium]|nr:hypothetical protein [Cytophagales bacterium]
MPKGFFISLPSISINNTLIPVINKIASANYEILFYNTYSPNVEGKVIFKSYPHYSGGYNNDCINSSTSYYQLTEKLVDTAFSLLNYLMKEVEKEKPDFILHPHLGLWGKILASYYNLPAIMLSTTFVMEKEIMLPYFKKEQKGRQVDFMNILSAMQFYKKGAILCKKLNLHHNLDIWDAHVNKEALNLSFILREFQPGIGMLGQQYKFLGYPLPVTRTVVSEDLIYISLGTILNKNVEFYKLCIGLLSKSKINTVLAIGHKIDVQSLGEIPKNITVASFVDQIEILKRTTLFITSGGMGSVNESIHTLTPMIVIPQTIEQRITAQRIEELGIGIKLGKNLTEMELQQGITHMFKNNLHFYENLSALTSGISTVPSEDLALNHVSTFLKSKLN